MEVTMPAAEARFHDKIKPHLIERAPTERIVQTAQRHWWFIVSASEFRVKHPFDDPGGETPMFGPTGHRSRFLTANHGSVGQYRGAFRRGRDDIDVLQDQIQLRWFGIGEKAESPKIGLAEMA